MSLCLGWHMPGTTSADRPRSLLGVLLGWKYVPELGFWGFPTPRKVAAHRHEGLALTGGRRVLPSPLPMSAPSLRYQIWIDRGGTFTDCICRDRTNGAVRVEKVLSSDDAPLVGIRRLLDLDTQSPIPPCDVRMGTTLATNALLERTGARVALVTTAGFGDLLHVGDQSRPDLFALAIRVTRPLHEAVLEVSARRDSEGRVVSALDESAVRQGLASLHAQGISSLAVALLHAHRSGEDEARIAAIAYEEGFAHVSSSHEVAPGIGLVGRGDSAVVDAYLTPRLRAYLARLMDALPGSRLRVMQSNGGLVEAARFRGRDAILSGPAGGVVATGAVAVHASLPRVVGFDMGGTSTDVSRWEGRAERIFEATVAGTRVRAPMIDIHTVAAGGGSICRFDGRRFTVGPESAGARPGPLCYGDPAAHALTLTDVSVALGRVRADRFPFPLATERARAALEEMARVVREATGRVWTWADIAEGFLQVAVENMAAAIREVSIVRGHDVREHAMVVFGGAGGQYAGRVARRLGIRTLVFHPFAGVLSAYGMGVAPVSWHGDADAGNVELDAEVLPQLAGQIDALTERGRQVLVEDGFTRETLRIEARVELRYAGTETAIAVPWSQDVVALRGAFEAAHQKRFGYRRRGHRIEIATLRVRVDAEGDSPRSASAMADSGPDPSERASDARVFVGDTWRDVPVRARESLRPEEALRGPLLVLEGTGTIFVEPGFVLTVDREGVITLEDVAPTTSASTAPGAANADPVLLEIFGNLFMSIAEQMGAVLRRTALSTNIRERLDFSCAVFDAEGGLVANAPHIPVHLGAMGESVLAVRAAHPRPTSGEVFATNDPAGGGSHLPDITVVTPVHVDGRLAFWVASRGHHADVGGITPGSMPPFSSRLDEEGVVFRNTRIVFDGTLAETDVRRVLGAGPHPARRPDENVADLEAQIAANAKGVQLLRELCARWGEDVVTAYMAHVQNDAAALVAEAIAGLPNEPMTFEDALDDGARIVVRVEREASRLTIDFAGTDPAVAGTLNAPRAVTVAAVLYVLRTLVGRPIPLNAGCLRDVTLRIPPGSLLDPEPWRAVAGGNVETSQRIVDVLLGALGRAAASQGTMNNLSFGTDRFGYYETIGGGAGAGDGFDGASGVHTHMTNSRITDPEVLEARFPVRLVTFGLRRGSGGAGRWHGGDGLVRELELLAPMRVSLLTERRTRQPFGLAGGSPGAAGRNWVDGHEVPGKVTLDLAAGARLRLETPGGGGYGPPGVDEGDA